MRRFSDELRLVIIGGDAAGMSAASKARRLDSSANIVVLEQKPYVSYALCGTPYYIGGVVKDLERLKVRSPEYFREKLNIDCRTRHRAVAVDVRERVVEVEDLATGRRYEAPYDKLLFACGARPRPLPCTGASCARVFGLRSLEEADYIRRELTSKRAPKVLVVGASYVGLEVIEAAHNLGAHLEVVELAHGPLPRLSTEIQDQVKAALDAKGIRPRFGCTVTEITEGAGDRLHCVLSDGATLDVDLVITGVGVLPASELAAEAGVRLGARGAIAVDNRAQTETPNVYAAGDCAEVNQLLLRAHAYRPLGTVANKQGRVAGSNMAGQRALMPGVLGTAMVKVFELEVASTGLTPADSEEAGFEILTTAINAKTPSSYFPSAAPITVLVHYRADDGLVVGAEIAGGPGSAPRINTLATAVTAGMTVQELGKVDLGYAPPFSGVYDPVTLAANVASKKYED